MKVRRADYCNHLGDVHILPLGDLYIHRETRECWCRPTLTQEPDASVVITHHSADGRELVERHGVN